MSAFLFAFVAVLLTSFGSRDQLLVARFADGLGRNSGLLAAALAVSVLTAGLMAWAGSTISAMLPSAAKTMFIAMALLAAAIELAWPARSKPLLEPTRSIGAVTIVLAGYQITDGARFLIFAMAAAFPGMLMVGAGGALGGCLAMVAAWTASDQLFRAPLRLLRMLLAVVLFIAAVVIGLSARGLINQSI